MPTMTCPSCSAALAVRGDSRHCVRCRRRYPTIAGLPDLRLFPDRYLELPRERAKAERLARIAERTDLNGLIEAYYSATTDVDALRKGLYSGHIRRAEARGAALAETLPSGGIVLEIGCGSGGFLAAMARSGRPVVGVDIALRWLVAARRRLADLGESTPLIAASADRLPWPDATFDAVVADSVLEHLEDPAAVVREWARVLRPGGELRIWSPNRWSILRDPHVGLLGVGWLPGRTATAYVRLRRNCPWTIRTLGAVEASRLLDGRHWNSIGVEPAPLSESMVDGRIAKAAMRIQDAVRRRRVGSAILRTIGPLWQVRATRTDQE